MLKRIRSLLGLEPKDTAKKSPDRKPARPAVHQGPKVVHRPIPASDLDPDAVKIVRRLTRFDHKAYLVGGCVRDLLLDRKPKDFDIGTSATPRQIKRVFRNSRIIGRRFKLAHVYFQQGKIIEVATFRAGDAPENGDGEPGDDLLIRDDNVFGTLEEDALRRDFTINQLFYDLGEERVLDHADGLADLRRKLVRTIGDPEIRFREDPIRILRAIKFAARLGFDIEKETLASLEGTRDELNKAATPRILEEVNRFCRGGAARASFEWLGKTGVFETVFPELERTYRDRGERWQLMLDLFGRMDEVRGERAGEIRTGEIFAGLMLPLIGESFGWSSDGKAERPRGLNVRKCIDDQLRPMALRLRIPRREQEYCRQLLGTLYRMVPSRRTRRNTRRAILGRECLADARWMLQTLGERLGGDFSEAYAYWGRPAEGDEEGEGGRREAQQQESGSTGTRRRRRRRRGGRRRSGSGGGEDDASGKEEQAEEAPPKPDMPSKWDDDYFFAALPSAPEVGGEEATGDRYGTAEVQGEAPAEQTQETQETQETDDGPLAAPTARKRRPRRRRRRRGARGAGEPEKPEPGPGEGADD
jgi:poly(A) polymerase